MRKTKPLSNLKIKLKIQFKQNQFYHHLKKKIYQKPNGFKDINFEGFNPLEENILLLDDVNCSKSDELTTELLLLANHKAHRVRARYKPAFLCCFEYIIMCSN